MDKHTKNLYFFHYTFSLQILQAIHEKIRAVIKKEKSFTEKNTRSQKRKLTKRLHRENSKNNVWECYDNNFEDKRKKGEERDGKR